MRVGQKLVVPGAGGAEAAAEPASKSSRKAEKSRAEADTRTYTVHKRETPHSVAKKFHISVKELAKLNPDMGKKLRSGQKLTVPSSSHATRNAPEEVPEAEAAPAPRSTEVAAVTPPKSAKTPSAEPAIPTLPDSKQSVEAEAFFEKGIESGKQNKFQKAVEFFDKAIKLNGNRADYYASRGHAHYYLKQYAKAIDDYSKAIEKNPNFALAYSMRGLSRTRSGHYPQAIEDFNRAIALGPKEADYYKGRGFTYLHLKQASSMCQDYKKACDLGDCELLESARKEKACP
jgi:tetratricopeptide (TPR) repeat protein